VGRGGGRQPGNYSLRHEPLLLLVVNDEMKMMMMMMMMMMMKANLGPCIFMKLLYVIGGVLT
jgi:hypothetical protein